ncbi:MAG: hypothetical protein KDC54_12110 [Lewinella sp.]|nr:hypothetical protein [Lewinella sp.]
MKNNDSEIKAEHRRLAGKLARRMKDFGFDVLGLDDGNLIRHEAWNFKYGTHPPKTEFTLYQAEIFIAEEFEGLYGVTPSAYWDFIEQEQMNDGRPREQIQAEAEKLAPIFRQIMGRTPKW